MSSDMRWAWAITHRHLVACTVLPTPTCTTGQTQMITCCWSMSYIGQSPIMSWTRGGETGMSRREHTVQRRSSQFALLVALGLSGVCLSACAQPSASVDAPVGSPGSAELVEVSSHCGIKYMWYAGRHWEAENPLPDPGPQPAGDGLMSYKGTVSGKAVWVDDTTVNLIVEGLPVVTFHPARSTPAPCA
jgi:hypothetical protein